MHGSTNKWWTLEGQLLRHVAAWITHPSDARSRLKARWRIRATTDPKGVRTHEVRAFCSGQRVLVLRRHVFTSNTDALRVRLDRGSGPGAVVLQRGRIVWVSMRARFGKCTTYQLRLASADEEAAADLVSNDDWRDLKAQTSTGKPLGAVVV